MKLVFLHIPKAGGTSLSSCVARHFNGDKIFPWQHAGLYFWPKEQLMKYDYFSGHYNAYDLDHLGSDVQVITMLRRPIDRIHSLYSFWKAQPDSSYLEPSHARLAHNHEFSEFILCSNPAISGAVDNYMTQCLIRYPLRGRNRELSASVDTIINDALETLTGMNSFGFLEHFNRTVEHIGSCLGIRLIPPSKHFRKSGKSQNAAININGLSEEINSRLDELIALDSILYDKALNIFPSNLKDQSRPDQGQQIEWIDFCNLVDLSDLEMEGWGEQEEWGIWSVGSCASMYVKPLIPHDSGIRMVFHVIVPNFLGIEPPSVSAFIQSTKVVEWVFGVEASAPCHEFSLTVASEAFDEDGGVRIVFELKGLTSPASLSVSGDTRMLGIGIKSVMISSIS